MCVCVKYLLKNFPARVRKIDPIDKNVKLLFSNNYSLRRSSYTRVP